MAVTRGGIPIRVWSWPGNTNDSALIRQVKDDLRAWKLGRVVWVADRGFTSAREPPLPATGRRHYILGEKLRGGSPEADAALSRQGRYQTVADNLQVKEVVIDDGMMRDRFVICRNPEQAERDRIVRDQLLDSARRCASTAPTSSPPPRRAALAGRAARRAAPVPAHHPGRTAARRPCRGRCRGTPRRQVPVAHRGPDPHGRRHRVRLQATPRSRTGLAGHEVHPRTAPRLPPPRGPHPRPRRAVLARPAVDPYRRNPHRRHLAEPAPRPRPIHLGTFTGPAGTVHRRTATTHAQARILAALDLDEPREFSELRPATTPAA